MEDNISRIDNEGADAAVKAVEAPSTPPTHIVLSNGVSFKLQPVPPLLVRRAQANVTFPEVPIVFNEEQGRAIENPLDPDYMRRVEQAREAENEAVMNVMMLVGTRVDQIPEGIEHPESNVWVETLTEVGVLEEGFTFRSDTQRRLAWMRMVAIPTVTDLNNLVMAVGRLTGVTEQAVASAVDSFRRDGEGLPAPGSDVQAHADNGNSVPVTSGDGSGTGGA